MKNNIFKILASVAILFVGTISYAQQVNTLYFLENAPTRNYINPAFEPLSKVYVSLPVLGWTSLSLANNSFSVNDFLFKQNGQWMTFLNPQADKEKFFRKMHRSTLIEADMQINLLSFGFRIKEKGYGHFTLNAKTDAGFFLPKDFGRFLFNGGMVNAIDGGTDHFNFKSLGMEASAYIELGLGYSHRINDQWTVGGKLKLNSGIVYMGVTNKRLDWDGSVNEWNVLGKSNIRIAGPISLDALPNKIDRDYIENFSTDDLLNTDDILSLVKPSGFGAGVDLGFTYKPHPMVQISGSVTDLGFIYWGHGKKYKMSVDTTFNGVGEFEYSKYLDEDDNFDSDSLVSDIKNNLLNYVDAMHAESSKNGFARMTSPKLNIGVDANFWENRVGVGLYSRTKIFNSNVYEELTLGAAFRPVHWFNLALSYSFINGNWSSLGFGLGLITYEGLGLTLVMDYIPTSYAKINNDALRNIPLPYKMKAFDFALGLNIVIGHKQDKDKDGVVDSKDLCEKTPRKVQVDEYGCPIDSDGDGVPDYLDQCPNTPDGAYGYVDEYGCPIDTDGDGVPDFLDLCAGTPQEAWGKVDEHGCALDSDGDGVPDYLDQCPDTPKEAIGYVDENGCLLDTDGDGVPDYLDQCPNTPQEAIGFVDESGCELDSDNDSVPDWKDQCPDTPKEAIGHVDQNGCVLDSDEDGVPDYLDQCPMVPGTKENNGCPALKKEVRNLLKKAMQGIQFETGKATIKKTSYALLDQIAAIFISEPTYMVEVQGHTDNVGKADFNMNLSEKRAQSVRKYLIDAGVPEKQLTAHGYGDTMPIADNKTAKGRALNRRVEFVVSFEEITYEMVNDHATPTAEQTTTEN